jgi:hypothetical protein
MRLALRSLKVGFTGDHLLFWLDEGRSHFAATQYLLNSEEKNLITLT